MTETLTNGLPTNINSQPYAVMLIFDLGKMEGFYLDRNYTADEQTFQLGDQIGVIRPITRRQLPLLLVKQGDGGITNLPIKFTSFMKPVDMTGYHLAFSGIDYAGYPVETETDNTVNDLANAKQGIINFTFPKAISVHDGDYHNACFIIRDADYNRVATLPFNVRVLADSNAAPAGFKHKEYWGEGERALYEMCELQRSSSQLIGRTLANMSKDVDLMTGQLNDKATKIFNNLISRIQKIEDGIKSNDFIRKVDLVDAVNANIESGKIDISDIIDDSNVRAKIYKLVGEAIPKPTAGLANSLELNSSEATKIIFKGK